MKENPLFILLSPCVALCNGSSGLHSAALAVSKGLCMCGFTLVLCYLWKYLQLVFSCTHTFSRFHIFTKLWNNCVLYRQCYRKSLVQAKPNYRKVTNTTICFKHFNHLYKLVITQDWQQKKYNSSTLSGLICLLFFFLCLFCFVKYIIKNSSTI